MSCLKKRFNHFVKWLRVTKTARVQSNGIGIKPIKLNGVNDLIKLTEQQIIQAADSLELKIMETIQDKYDHLQSLESLIAYRKLFDYLKDDENKCLVCSKSLSKCYNLAITKCGHISCYSCLVKWEDTYPKDDIDYILYMDRPNDLFNCPSPNCRQILKLHEVFEMNLIIQLMALDEVIKKKFCSKN